MRNPDHPFWTGGRVMAAGAALVLAVVAALAWVGVYQRNELLGNEQADAELLARVLEDHATRTLDAAAIALTALADIAAAPGAIEDPKRMAPSLSHTLLALSSVRSVAALDLQGRVLASSSSSEVGARVNLAVLGPIPEPGQDALGPVVAGRGLSDLSRADGVRRAPAGVSFMTLLRRVDVPGRAPLLVAALINPDALSSYQQVTLGDDTRAGVLASIGGKVLASTNTAGLAPGTSVDLPLFREQPALRDHGSFVGQGVRPGQQIVAYRVSRRRPLVMLVEQPYAVVVDRWIDAMQWFAAPAAGAVVLIMLGCLAVQRTLRSREAARAHLRVAQHEVALRERELSVLVKSVQEVIFRTDAAGRLTFVNARWLALTGGAAEALHGRTLGELVLPAHRAAVDAMWQPRAEGAARTALAAVMAADGRERWFEFSAVPLLSDGEVVSFAGSGADVTDRREAQQHLQRQLGFTELLLEISPLPVAMLNLQGRYVIVNQAWQEFRGLSREQVLGLRAADFLPRHEADRHDAQDAALLARGGRTRYDATVRHADGSLRDVVLTKVVVPDENGQAAGILILLIDVTEFRDAERATREARDVAEEASRAKSEFIANISHELRTPLQSILGFSELGLTRGRDQPRLAAMFEDIHASGGRMLALVNDLLDVAKIESTVGAFHLERTDLRGLLRAVGREFEPQLSHKHLRLALSLSEGPLVAKVDPMRFSQVLRNVLANAVKFSPPGGLIEASADATPAGEFHVAVRDHGPGIPEAEIESVFEAFVQSSQTKDGSGGTGLGLAICRKIVDAHGGRIRAENMPDGGCVFHIHLPSRVFAETRPME